MDIYFLDLKYGFALNCSYVLENGNGKLDFEKTSYSVGDEVNLFMGIPRWQHEAIKDNCIDKMVDTNGCIMGDCHIMIEFVVKRKRHVLVHSNQWIGTLQPHSPNIYLEPVSWGHEDIFKWICMGELPSWITEEELAEYREPQQE